MSEANLKSILLINPWIYDFTAYDLWMKPLGLLYIGSFLEKRNYKVYLIDCLYPHLKDKSFGCGKLLNQFIPKPDILKGIPRRYKRYGITPEVFLKELSHFASSVSPLFIAVTSMMTYWYPGVFEAIKHIRRVFPDTPIALGGVYATLCYEHAVKHSGADYIIKGPGEIEALKLADKLAGNNSERLSLPDLPYPAYHLYPAINYVSMLTSRGCPFRCTYCASSLLYQGFYQRPPEKAVSEIEYYMEKFGVKDIAFYDDALLVNAEKHIDRIMDLIIQKGINRKVRFHTPNGLHIKYITEERAGKMAECGFKTIRLGFESSSPDYQAKSSHKVTNEEFAQCFNNLCKAGFSREDIAVYIMAGLPGQTLNEINETIGFVRDQGAKIKIAKYSPIPGTSDFQRDVKEYGLNPDEPLLHNKSIYPAKLNDISFRQMEKIETKAKNPSKRRVGQV